MTTNPFLRGPSPSIQGWRQSVRWGNGSPMQDGLANILRPLVFDSIMSYIDWDMAGLVQGYFAGTSSGLFRRGSISFARQLTQAQQRPVRLTIPHVDRQQELDDAAIALEGLYLFSRHGNWNFPRGRDHFVVYANCLERMVRRGTVGKIQSFRDSCRGRWNVTFGCRRDAHCGRSHGRQGTSPKVRRDRVVERALRGLAR